MTSTLFVYFCLNIVQPAIQKYKLMLNNTAGNAILVNTKRKGKRKGKDKKTKNRKKEERKRKKNPRMWCGCRKEEARKRKKNPRMWCGCRRHTTSLVFAYILR